MIDLSSYEVAAGVAPLVRAEGRVEKVVGLLVEISGLRAAVGRELEIDLPARRVTLEVIGFRDDRLLAAPLGPTSGIAPGDRVRLRTSEASAAPVSTSAPAVARPSVHGPRHPAGHASESGARVARRTSVAPWRSTSEGTARSERTRLAAAARARVTNPSSRTCR